MTTGKMFNVLFGRAIKSIGILACERKTLFTNKKLARKSCKRLQLMTEIFDPDLIKAKGNALCQIDTCLKVGNHYIL